MAEDTSKDNAKEDKPEQAVVLFRYVPDEASAGLSYPGVPPGDILEHQYETFPKWIQKSIAESPMYKAVEAKKKADDKADAGGK